jgi:dipeptidyl aminopeptidase/acylaminoacyl peptidase
MFRVLAQEGDENHNLSRTGKPKHRLERLEHILRWFETRM